MNKSIRKESIRLLLLQALNAIVSVFSIFYLAANIDSKSLAIIAVFEIINSLTVVFSNSGIESLAMRRIMLFKKSKKHEEISRIISYCFSVRIVHISILYFALIPYVVYLSIYKYSGEYLTIFILMIISSSFFALNNTHELLLKSYGKFFKSALIPFFSNTLGRITAVFLFINYGFDTYIYARIVIPILISITLFFTLFRRVSYTFSLKGAIKTYKEGKEFRWSNYVSFVYDRVDTFLVSIFLSSEFLAAYSLGRRVLFLGVMTIKNLSNPSIQNTLLFKDSDVFQKKINDIYLIRNKIVLVIIPLLIILIFAVDSLISIAGLNHLPNLEIHILTSFAALVPYAFYKYSISLVSLYLEPKIFFVITLYLALMSLFFMAVVGVIDVKYLGLYSVFSYLAAWFLIIKRKNEGIAIR